MRIAIHQSNFIPFLGFFHKMTLVDEFVLFDTPQFVSKQYLNRNRIRTGQGWQWLIVPTRHCNQNTIIKDVKIANEHVWQKKMRRSIEVNYKLSPYFDKYYPMLCYLLSDCMWEYLADLNIAIIKQLNHWLGISTALVRHSDMKAQGDGQQLLADICKELGADEYVTGSTEKDYHDQEVFDAAGIKVVPQNFKHPEYNQLFKGKPFEPNMSVVDLLFMEGPRALDIIMREDYNG